MLLLHHYHCLVDPVPLLPWPALQVMDSWCPGKQKDALTTAELLAHMCKVNARTFYTNLNFSVFKWYKHPEVQHWEQLNFQKGKLELCPLLLVPGIKPCNFSWLGSAVLQGPTHSIHFDTESKHHHEASACSKFQQCKSVSNSPGKVWVCPWLTQ